MEAERINSVDVLRGVALLGILLINILSFGLPGPVSENPAIAGGATGINLWTWFGIEVLFEGKMRALFSMLFGAGLVLMWSRAEQRGSIAGFADIWLRRTLWLMLFGMLHAYLVWDGDVLFFYGASGLFLYPFRKMRPATLLIIGLSLLTTQIPKIVAEMLDTRVQKAEYDIALAVPGSRLPLTEELKKATEQWKEKLKDQKPDQEALQKIVTRMRSGYLTILQHRAAEMPGKETFGIDRFVLWDVMGMMFLGMALLKMGILSAERSGRFYAVMLLAGFGIGIPVCAASSWYRIKSGFDVLSVAPAYLTYDLGRMTVASGHIGLVMLICRAGAVQWLTGRLAAVGQMALTNYLMHSFICTTLFYGYGASLFAKLERYQLYYLVAAIWLLQLVVSPIWLRHFQFGPMEWVWRSLTYWKRQPMHIPKPAVLALS